MPLSPWILQILILAAGIHLFLRFVRTTRGSRLIRGLLLTVAVGFVGLWGVSKAFDLEELSHLLHGSTGFVLIAFVIVFQQEVRRAIAQIGGTSVVGRLMNPAAGDTLRRAARAARSMASRRCGALIAFERGTSLESFVEAGTQVDATVTARLLETLFHPGSPLHDGGVVVRRDRVAEAGCIFPLPEQASIDPRLGTRHRAAMGLTEDTDAVVLVVSEETGAISLARNGQLRTVLSPDEVEDELRRMVEGEEGSEDEAADERRGGRPRWLGDLVWLPASLLLATGILYVAHQDIRTDKEYYVTVADAASGGTLKPRVGEILVVLPGEDYQLTSGEGPQRVVVSGSRSQLETIGENLSGTFVLGEAFAGEKPLLLSEVSWQRPVLGVRYEWTSGTVPLLRLGRYEERRAPLSIEDLVIDDEELDDRHEVLRDRVSFEPEPTLQLRGPADGIGRPLSELLEPLVLARSDLNDVRLRLRLRQASLDAGFSIERPVHVTIPIAPARRDAGTVTKEIALVSTDPLRLDELASWALPAHAQTARYRIETVGLIPVGSDPGSTAYRERIQAIRNYVEKNLQVFVDLGEVHPDGGGQSVEVRHYWRGDWEPLLGSTRESVLSGRESLKVVLESEKEIRLERRQAPTPGEAAGGGPGG